MNPETVLAAYDEQIRRHPAPETPADLIERDGAVVRVVAGTADGWNAVTWSDLAVPPARHGDDVDRGDGSDRGDSTDNKDGPARGDDVDEVISGQIARFARLGYPWEWKHYSYDRPADLPQRLIAAGFTAEPAEALMVAEIADLDLDVPPPAGVDLVDVIDEAGVQALVDVHQQVFGGDHSRIGRVLLAELDRRPTTMAAVVAFAEGMPISAGRIEFTAGTQFASIWGGGTLAAWRGRGVFRALVAHRAAAAAAGGFRYLQVDASDDSRPILGRLGFVELAITTPFKHPGTPAARTPATGTPATGMTAEGAPSPSTSADRPRRSA